MDMICHTTDADRRAIYTGEGSAEVFECAWALVGDQVWFAVFGAEHEMDENARERLGHGRNRW
jgi:hypothetical protein